MLKLEDFKIKEVKTDKLAKLTGGINPKGRDYYDADTYAMASNPNSGWTNEVWDWNGVEGHYAEGDQADPIA